MRSPASDRCTVQFPSFGSGIRTSGTHNIGKQRMVVWTLVPTRFTTTEVDQASTKSCRHSSTSVIRTTKISSSRLYSEPQRFVVTAPSNSDAIPRNYDVKVAVAKKRCWATKYLEYIPPIGLFGGNTLVPAINSSAPPRNLSSAPSGISTKSPIGGTLNNT